MASREFLLQMLISLDGTFIYCITFPRSDKWHLVPPEVRKTLGLKQELDGEFWMNFSDFCQFFSRVYICTLGPDFDRDGIVDNSKICLILLLLVTILELIFILQIKC